MRDGCTRAGVVDDVDVLIAQTIDRLERYISANHYRGYEPYDGLNTPFAFLRRTKVSRLLLTHGNKLSPVNLRPILGVKKYQHTKTLALLLSAYCNLYELTGRSAYRDGYTECRDLLLAKELPGGGIGGSYDYQTRNWLASKNGLSTLGTILTIRGLLRGYTCFSFDGDLEKARSLTRAVVARHITHADGGVHVTYASGQSRAILNVYSLTAGTLSMVYSATGEPELLDLARQIVAVVVHHQFANGAWPYVAGEPYEATQIDFHQGFILEGLCDYVDATGVRASRYVTALLKGCHFYAHSLFLPNGASRFRLRSKYPVDIHNQSEGILAFSRCASLERMYTGVADRILRWTVSHMYDRRQGCFYYQKWPVFTNRIPYMAWGQALMLVALSTFALQNMYASRDLN